MKLALGIVLCASVAAAQPSQTLPSPAPTVPPPYAYQPPYPQQLSITITPEQRQLLDDGEISDGQHLGGGLAALVFGFGSGQAIQGRWSDNGWWFTAGDAASVVVMFWGLTRTVSCIDDRNRDCSHLSDTGLGEFFGGLIAFGGLRIWQTVDAFVVPPEHNRRVRRLRAQLGMSPAGIYGRW